VLDASNGGYVYIAIYLSSDSPGNSKASFAFSANGYDWEQQSITGGITIRPKYFAGAFIKKIAGTISRQLNVDFFSIHHQQWRR
jgi:hypothetical protein